MCSVGSINHACRSRYTGNQSPTSFRAHPKTGLDASLYTYQIIVIIWLNRSRKANLQHYTYNNLFSFNTTFASAKKVAFKVFSAKSFIRKVASIFWPDITNRLIPQCAKKCRGSKNSPRGNQANQGRTRLHSTPVCTFRLGWYLEPAGCWLA